MAPTETLRGVLNSGGLPRVRGHLFPCLVVSPCWPPGSTWTCTCFIAGPSLCGPGSRDQVWEGVKILACAAATKTNPFPAPTHPLSFPYCHPVSPLPHPPQTFSANWLTLAGNPVQPVHEPGCLQPWPHYSQWFVVFWNTHKGLFAASILAAQGLNSIGLLVWFTETLRFSAGTRFV